MKRPFGKRQGTDRRGREQGDLGKEGNGWDED